MIERAERFAAYALALGFTGAAAWVARAHTHFHGDDINNIYQLEQLPLTAFLLLPADAHFSPLHRLTTAVMHRCAPWNFDMALVVLVCMQLVGVVYVHRVVRLLWDSPRAVWITTWYAANVLLGFQFMWWASATHRLPYVALSAVSTYYYLVHRHGGGRRALILSFAAFLGALGFFAKAVLVPVLLLGVELALVNRPTAVPARRRIATIGAMLAVSLVFGLGVLDLLASPSAEPGSVPALGPHLRFGLDTYLYGIFGLLPPWPRPAWSVVIPASVVGLFVWSTYRTPINVVPWLAAALLLGANVVMPALAPRAGPWTLLATIANQQYYYEGLFALAILASIVIANLTGARESTRTGGAPRAARSAAVIVLVLTIYAGVSLHGVRTALGQNRARIFTRTYMSNLIGDLTGTDAPTERPLLIATGRIPGRVMGLYAGPASRFENLLPLIDPRVVVVAHESARYRVADDGRVVPIGADARPD